MSSIALGAPGHQTTTGDMPTSAVTARLLDVATAETQPSATASDAGVARTRSRKSRGRALQKSAVAGRSNDDADIADRRFFAARRYGQLALAGTLWLSIAAMIGAGAAAEKMALDPAASVGVAIAVGVGVYAFISTVAALLLDHALERKLNAIRRVARIGCERMRIDDSKLIRSAIQDVLTEWMHINFFALRFREESLIVTGAFLAQAFATAVGLLVVASASGLTGGEAWLLIVGPLALTGAHAVLHVWLLRRQMRSVTVGDDNPTEVLANRMVALLDEVKDLRKPALHR